MRHLLLVLPLIVLSGCCIPEASKVHVERQVAGHDGAARLISATVRGQLAGEAAADNVTQDDLDNTPAPVRKLLNNVIRMVWESRESWHTINFSLLDGPDPQTLDLGVAPVVTARAVLFSPR